MTSLTRISTFLLSAIVLGTLLLTPLSFVYAQTGGGNPATGGLGGGNPDTGGLGGGNPDTGGETLINPLKVGSIPELLNIILDAVIQIGTVVLVLMLVWVGFLFVMARGNPEGVSKAKAALFWTVIGGLILLGARGISEVIQSTANTL